MIGGIRRCGAVAAAILATLPLGGVSAGEVTVEAVELRAEGGSRFTVSATLRHADTGWDHYANAFEVLGPDGAVLGTRVLHHPHVNEQPFTRSLSGVGIPAAVAEVTVRGQDSVHGTGGPTVTIQVPHGAPAGTVVRAERDAPGGG